MGSPAWVCSSIRRTICCAEAVRLTGAPVVDVSSGVESAPGVKDVALIRAFVKAARS